MQKNAIAENFRLNQKYNYDIIAEDKNESNYLYWQNKEKKTKKSVPWRLRLVNKPYLGLNLGLYADTINRASLPSDTSFFTNVFGFNQSSAFIGWRLHQSIGFEISYTRFSRSSDYRDVSTILPLNSNRVQTETHIMSFDIKLFSPMLFSWKFVSIELSVNAGIFYAVSLSRVGIELSRTPPVPPSTTPAITNVNQSILDTGIGFKIGGGVEVGLGKYVSLRLGVDFYNFKNYVTMTDGIVVFGLGISVHPF